MAWCLTLVRMNVTAALHFFVALTSASFYTLSWEQKGGQGKQNEVPGMAEIEMF